MKLAQEEGHISHASHTDVFKRRVLLTDTQRKRSLAARQSCTSRGNHNGHLGEHFAANLYSNMFYVHFGIHLKTQLEPSITSVVHQQQCTNNNNNGNNRKSKQTRASTVPRKQYSQVWSETTQTVSAA